MPTALGNIGNGFYTAFNEPDSIKRREALAAWAKSATPGIQESVEGELMEFIERVCEGRWTEEGWNRGRAKLQRIQNDYPLVMDIGLRSLHRTEKYLGQLPDRVYYKPPTPGSAPVTAEPKPAPATYDCGDDGYDDVDDDGGHGSHDDQAAMDNHADQMNPNNDAYWSSRG